MMKRLRPLSRQEIRQLDVQAARDLELPTLILMENAGRGAAAWLAELAALRRNILEFWSCAGLGTTVATAAWWRVISMPGVIRSGSYGSHTGHSFATTRSGSGRFLSVQESIRRPGLITTGLSPSLTSSIPFSLVPTG